jgi:hypothetical protein
MGLAVEPIKQGMAGVLDRGEPIAQEMAVMENLFLLYERSTCKYNVIGASGAKVLKQLQSQCPVRAGQR